MDTPQSDRTALGPRDALGDGPDARQQPGRPASEPDVPPESLEGLVWLRILWVFARWGRSAGAPPAMEAKLSMGQVNALFAGIEDKYPPLLTYEQAADLVQVALPTLKGWFSQGKYAGCVRRGKPGRVVRDLFVQQFLRDGFGINAG